MNSGIRCACGVMVYEGESLIIRNHDLRRMDDGRMQWFSRDFQVVVHECDPSFGVVAQAEQILAEA